MIKEVNIFHTLSEKQTLKSLSSTREGLSKEQALSRLKEIGPNLIPEKKKKSLIFLYFKQLNSLLIYILIAAAVISYFYGHLIDVYVIVGVIIINATIGFVQEEKAGKAIEALKKMIVLYAKVYRSSQLLQIKASNLVPGDIINLEEGDRIPADCRLLEIKNFKTVESSLTGESLPSEKNISLLPKKTSLADRKNMVWMGTFVASGSAIAVVVSTGGKTAIGTLALEIDKIKKTKSHFQKKSDKLALFMAIIAIIGASITFIVGYFIREFEFSEIFLFTIASLVSGIPEGLPAVLAIVLAIGAFRMSRRKALVRNLPATETLAVVDTIITDKTGTLTQNTMTIEKVIIPNESEITVSGEGWVPKGEFSQKGKSIIPTDLPQLSRLLRISSLGTKAILIKKVNAHEQYKIIGDPTEASLTVLSEKAGFKKAILLEKNKILDDLPFNQELRYRASLISSEDGKEVFVIGSPESVLNLCSHYQGKSSAIKLSLKDKNKINSQLDNLTNKALRVLAVAYLPVSNDTQELQKTKIDNLILAGLVGMKDPPRPEVKSAILKAKSAGIRIIMATGDHKNTAIAIGKEIGLISEENKDSGLALSETELISLEKKSKKEFEESIKNLTIFARLSPGMKLKIASVLQKEGHVVAMTGDGVNDAPALKKADIGISMGLIGTDVARASSEIILADDNFASIINAVEEGRTVFTNTRQSASFLVTTNFAEHATIITTLLLGLPLPLITTQILWLNLVTDTGSGLGLAAEPSHNDTLNEPPKNPNENFLTKSIIPFVIIMFSLMTIITLIFFYYFLPFGIEKARTAAFAVMAFTQLFNTYNMRSAKKSIFKLGFFSNKYITIAIIASVALTIIALYVPFIQSLFNFSTLSILQLISIVALSSLVLWAGELYKLFLNKK